MENGDFSGWSGNIPAGATSVEIAWKDNGYDMHRDRTFSWNFCGGTKTWSSFIEGHFLKGGNYSDSGTVTTNFNKGTSWNLKVSVSGGAGSMDTKLQARATLTFKY